MQEETEVVKVLRSRDDIMLAAEAELRNVVAVVTRAVCDGIREIPGNEISAKHITRRKVQLIVKGVFENLEWQDLDED